MVVKNTDGKQFYVEAIDPLSFNARLFTEEGEVIRDSIRNYKLIDETDVRQSAGLAPGSKVQILQLNPGINPFRERAVTEPGEAAGIVGHIGEIVFAYYPIDNKGTTMYRVRMSSGRRDFSSDELGPVSESAIKEEDNSATTDGGVQAGSVVNQPQDTIKPKPKAAGDKEKKPGQKILLDKKPGVITKAVENICTVALNNGSILDGVKAEDLEIVSEGFVGMSAIPALGLTGGGGLKRAIPVTEDDFIEGSRVYVRGVPGVVLGFPSMTETSKTVRVLFDDGGEKVVEMGTVKPVSSKPSKSMTSGGNATGMPKTPSVKSSSTHLTPVR